jgi:hypothetical protein
MILVFNLVEVTETRFEFLQLFGSEISSRFLRNPQTRQLQFFKDLPALLAGVLPTVLVPANVAHILSTIFMVFSHVQNVSCC